jgi:hypothetical protein
MARISTYQKDTSVEKTDKLLGSNLGGTTKNFAIEDISKFFKNTNAAGIAGQFTYQYKNSAPYGNGTMRVTFSSGSTFQNATSLKVSKYIYGEEDSSENLLDILASSKILIVDIEDQDNFGVYNTTTVTQDSVETDFYDIVISQEKANGSFTNEKFYAIISIGGGSDKQAVLTFDSSNFAADSETINGSSMRYVEWSHNLNKRPSITVAESGSPEQVAHVPVKYINDNTVKVYFTGTTSGKIYAN